MCPVLPVMFRGSSCRQCSNQRKCTPFRTSAQMLMKLRIQLKENVCVFEKILSLRWEDYLSVVVIHSNNGALTPVGNMASCVLTLTKKTVETAPLSVLFTSVD